MRYLVPGLLVEGDSDEDFLAPILRRELEACGLEAGFDVGEVRTGLTRTVAAEESVDRAARLLLDECQLLIVHHDLRERGKIDALRSRMAEGDRVVGLVPVRETEAWVLAAMSGVNVPGFDQTGVPAPLRLLQKDHDPKATLRRLYTRGEPVAAFARVAEAVELSVLAGLPSYTQFLEDLTNALKELRFL